MTAAEGGRPRPAALERARRARCSLGAAALLLPALGAAPLERAEIYFVDAARAMVERGDYLVPYYRASRSSTSRPLTYWLMAAAFRALRLHPGRRARWCPPRPRCSALAATVWLGRLLLGREAALLRRRWCWRPPRAFMAFGRVAMSDMLLTLWTTLAVTLVVQGAGGRAGLALDAALGRGARPRLPDQGPGGACCFPASASRLAPGGRGAIAARRSTAAGVLAAAAAFAVLGLGWFALPWACAWARSRSSTSSCARTWQRFAGETYDSGAAPLVLRVDLPRRGPALVAAAAPRGVVRAGAAPARRPRCCWCGRWPWSCRSASRAARSTTTSCRSTRRCRWWWARTSRARAWPRASARWARAAAVACAALLAVLPLLALRFPAEWLPARGPGWALVALAPLGALACAPGGAAAAARRSCGDAGRGVRAAVFLAAAVVLMPAFARRPAQRRGRVGRAARARLPAGRRGRDLPGRGARAARPALPRARAGAGAVRPVGGGRLAPPLPAPAAPDGAAGRCRRCRACARSRPTATCPRPRSRCAA